LSAAICLHFLFGKRLTEETLFASTYLRATGLLLAHFRLLTHSQTISARNPYRIE